MPTVVLPITLFVLLVIATLAWAARRRARQHLAALARALGLTFRVRDVLDLLDRYHNLTLLREGHDRRIWDVMSGPTRAGALSCFAFSYEAGFGVHRSVRSWLVAVLETDACWGRVALRARVGRSTKTHPWDTPCQAKPLRAFGNGDWTIHSRTEDAEWRLPASVLDWLDTAQPDACLELCGHLVAVQVPLAVTDRPVAWLVQAVQDVANLLSAANTPVLGAVPGAGAQPHDPSERRPGRAAAVSTGTAQQGGRHAGP